MAARNSSHYLLFSQLSACYDSRMRSLISLVWMPFFAFIFFVLQTQSTNPITQKRTDYVAPPIELKYLTVGFSSAVADSFWLRAIQDFDMCSQPLNEHECKGKSWLFHVLNLTVELDNKFLEAYYYGALALTIIISDYEGASVIFDKAVVSFSTNWSILYAAGYHAYFEEKNKLKASKLYLAAVNNGAPDWVRLTAGRLAGEGGDLNTAKDILQQLIDRAVDPAWIDILRKKIEQLEKNK